MTWSDIKAANWSRLTSTRGLILVILACAAGWWVLPLVVEILRGLLGLGALAGLGALGWRRWGKRQP